MNGSWHFRDNDETKSEFYEDGVAEPFVTVNIDRVGSSLSIFMKTAEQAEQLLDTVRQAYLTMRNYEGGKEFIDACDECGEYVDAIPPHASMCSFWDGERPKTSQTWRTRKEMAND